MISMKIEELNISYKNLMEDVDFYAEMFKENKILCFRQLNLSFEEQLCVYYAFNEYLNLYPVENDRRSFRYDEDHSHVTNRTPNNKDDVLVPWHLEHAETVLAQCVGFWNMYKFTCGKENGRTAFVDSLDILNLFTNEERDLLDKSMISSCKEGELDLKNKPVHYDTIDAMASHPFLGIESLRVDCSNQQKLVLVANSEPWLDEIAIFDSIKEKVMENIEKNEKIRHYWEWSQGDLLIVDVFSLYHSVFGGFTSDQRQFTGLWSFENTDRIKKHYSLN